MRILYFNLATDIDDPILGFATRWICALAERVEVVHVITMRLGRMEVPGNVRVYSVGKEKSYSEPRRVVEFYKILFRILREDRIDVCFSHMMPLFTVLAAPLLKARGIPIITWYAHPSVTWILRLAHQLSNQMVTSVASAYPYRRDKLAVIGQGIDMELFSPTGGASPQNPPTILCVGRLSPVKDHPTLIKAAALLRKSWTQPFRVVTVGGPGSIHDESHVLALHEQVKQLGLEQTVYLEPAVSLSKLPFWYRNCTAHVNLTPKGFGDKVALEAMACGRVCIVANAGFRETLGNYADSLLYTYGDAEQLAERLRWVLSLSRDERLVMGMYLRGRVESMHGLDRLAQNVVNIFESAIYSKAALGCTERNP
jgi:glycosyltransferase involved in cell wall biosynthesis